MQRGPYGGAWCFSPCPKPRLRAKFAQVVDLAQRPNPAKNMRLGSRRTEDSSHQGAPATAPKYRRSLGLDRGTVLSTLRPMPPKNFASEYLLRLLRQSALLRWCSLSMALSCVMDELQTSTLRSNVRPEEPSTTSTGEEREGPLTQGRRMFDSTVKPRLQALLALSATEIGQRECSAASPKEPVRGRIDRALLLAANEQLTLPMGAGSLLTVAGQPYLFCLEPHYHPPGGGITPEGWHKGVTVYHAQTPKERRL